MFILSNIGGTAWAAVAVVVLILILAAAGAIRSRYPEKKGKPWKKK